MTAELKPWLQELLASPPRAGEGVHDWLFRVARQLHAHFPAVEIIRLLETAVSNCGRHVPRNEIVSAVQNSMPCAWQPNGSNQTAPATKAWPELNQQRRRELLRDGVGLGDLWEASPVRMDSADSKAEAITDILFPGNPLLCCGRSNSDFDTKPREEWRGELSDLSLIVPSPMSSILGVTKEGKESKHTLSNTGARRFLIVEFDTGDFDEHASILFHLADYGPLVLAVHSGSKSLHGWFYCGTQPEEKLRKFMEYAVSLGADHAPWTRSQFVRMPDGTRENGKRQAVYFLNPKPLEVTK